MCGAFHPYDIQMNEKNGGELYVYDDSECVGH